MEDVLDIYETPYNNNRPVVCMDEKPYQLLGEAREELPARCGDTGKIDYEYIRTILLIRNYPLFICLHLA